MKKILALSLLGICCVNGNVDAMNNPPRAAANVDPLKQGKDAFYQKVEACLQPLIDCQDAFAAFEVEALRSIEQHERNFNEMNAQAKEAYKEHMNDKGIGDEDQKKALHALDQQIKEKRTALEAELNPITAKVKAFSASLKFCQPHIEFIKMLLNINKNLGESFSSWFSMNAKLKTVQEITDIKPIMETFKSKLGIEGEVPNALEEQKQALENFINEKTECNDLIQRVDSCCTEQMERIAKMENNVNTGDGTNTSLQTVYSKVDALLQSSRHELACDYINQLGDQITATDEQLVAHDQARAAAQTHLDALCRCYKDEVEAFMSLKTAQINRLWSILEETIMSVTAKL